MTEHTALPLSDLHHLRANPRRGDVELIKQSLQEHGQYRPAVVNDTPDGNTILVGNHMVQAMRELHEEHPDDGWGNVWVHKVRLTEQQARRLSLTDNRTSDRGDYNPQELLAELEALDALDGTGYDDTDLDGLQELLDDQPAPDDTDTTADDPFPYPGMRTITLALMEPVWEQWQHHANGFDTPEEALEYLLDHTADTHPGE